MVHGRPPSFSEPPPPLPPCPPPQSIIGAIGAYDSYQLADAKGYTAFSRYLLGISDEDRQKTREGILGTRLGFWCSVTPLYRQDVS